MQILPVYINKLSLSRRRLGCVDRARARQRSENSDLYHSSQHLRWQSQHINAPSGPATCGRPERNSIGTLRMPLRARQYTPLRATQADPSFPSSPNSCPCHPKAYRCYRLKVKDCPAANRQVPLFIVPCRRLDREHQPEDENPAVNADANVIDTASVDRVRERPLRLRDRGSNRETGGQGPVRRARRICRATRRVPPRCSVCRSGCWPAASNAFRVRRWFRSAQSQRACRSRRRRSPMRAMRG
jgi:hypothetical protein